MPKTLIETSLLPWMKWVNFLLALPVLVLPAVYLLFMNLAHGGPIALDAVLSVLFALGILSPLAEYRYRLVVTDKYVEQTYWRTVRIGYSDIRRVYVHPAALELESDKRKLKTLGTIRNRKQVLRILAEQIMPIPGIEYKGNASLVRELFGK